MYIVASALGWNLGVFLAPGGAAACFVMMTHTGCWWYCWRIVEKERKGRKGGLMRLGDAMDARTGEDHYLEMCWSRRRRWTCV